MSPFQLGILLHYYSCLDEAEEVKRNPPILEETMQQFVADGLLEPATHDHGASWQCTDKGKFFVEYICALPLPEHSWTIKP